MSEGESQDNGSVVYVVAIVAFYAIICIVAFVQLLRIFYYRHRLKSFHFGFLLLVFLWNMLRVLFFVHTWSTLVTYIIYWFPVDIQFATFSLLVVFYAYLVYTQQRIWETKKNLITTLYLLGNLCVFFLTSMYIGIGCQSGICNITEDLDAAHHVYMALQFLFLTILFGLYSFRLRDLRNNNNLNQTMTGGNVNRDVILTICAFIIFASRSVYNLAVAVGYEGIEISERPDGLKAIQFPAFALYMIWEVLPTFSLLVYFGQIPSSNVRHRRLCCWDTTTSINDDSEAFLVDDSDSYIANSPYSPYVASQIYGLPQDDSFNVLQDADRSFSNPANNSNYIGSQSMASHSGSYNNEEFVPSFYQKPAIPPKKDMYEDSSRYDTDDEDA